MLVKSFSLLFVCVFNKEFILCIEHFFLVGQAGYPGRLMEIRALNG